VHGSYRRLSFLAGRYSGDSLIAVFTFPYLLQTGLVMEEAPPDPEYILGLS